MTENNQAYIKRCNHCAKSVDKLYFTRVLNESKRKLFMMLCATCRDRATQ